MPARAKKVIIGALVLLAAGALYVLFIHFTHWNIPCVFRLITGLKCPGCGVTGVCWSLLHRDFKAAFRANPAIFCLLPLMVLTASRLIYLYIRYGKRRDKTTQIAVYFIIAVLLIFGVLRNIL